MAAKKKAAKRTAKKSKKRTAKKATRRTAAKGRPVKKAPARKRAAKKAVKRTAKKKTAKRTARRKTMKKATKRKPSAAFMKPMTPSAALAAVVGDKPLPRTEVTKKLWAYIKRKDLQDKKNRRNINADAALKAVFGGKATVNMFEMTKLVNKHLK
jgi:chromatin remodeling complex protein RSC6